MKSLLLLFLLAVAGFSACDTNAYKLVQSYEQIQDCRDNYIVWSDGTRMLYDDGKDKTFQEILDNPDIEDMFYVEYPQGPNSYTPPKYNYDPGRIRNEPFMKKLYGSSSNEVNKNLKHIIWMPKSISNKKISITGRNNVNIQLQNISNELDRLPKKLKKYVETTAGTFNWRNIAGTTRLSTHAFGTAIDINVQYSTYWQWKKEYKYVNQIPKEIVEIFEKYGFIWGGKWYHYDTMHFEYRPELLKKDAGNYKEYSVQGEANKIGESTLRGKDKTIKSYTEICDDENDSGCINFGSMRKSGEGAAVNKIKNIDI